MAKNIATSFYATQKKFLKYIIFKSMYNYLDVVASDFMCPDKVLACYKNSFPYSLHTYLINELTNK